MHWTPAQWHLLSLGGRGKMNNYSKKNNNSRSWNSYGFQVGFKYVSQYSILYKGMCPQTVNNNRELRKKMTELTKLTKLTKIMCVGFKSFRYGDLSCPKHFLPFWSTSPLVPHSLHPLFSAANIFHAILSRNDRRQMVTNHDDIGSPSRASNHEP